MKKICKKFGSSEKPPYLCIIKTEIVRLLCSKLSYTIILKKIQKKIKKNRKKFGKLKKPPYLCTIKQTKTL